METSFWGVDAVTAAAYDAAYWLAQPTAVQALKGTSFAPDPTTGLRPSVVLGQQLMEQGYQIDFPVMVWGEDPYLTMLQRSADGFTWVPAAGQTQTGGGTGPTPPGAITVTLTPLPPFAPVVPAPPAPAVSPVGPDEGFQIGGKEVFSCAATDSLPVGYSFIDSTGTYIKTALGTELMSPNQRICVWLKQ